MSHRHDPPARRVISGLQRWGRATMTLALVASVAACSDDDGEAVGDEIEDVSGAVADAIEEFGEDTVEVAARNLASRQGAEEFSDAGFEIDGDLMCTADASDDLTAVAIDCSGATTDGSVAALAGDTTELPGASLTELEGDFVGFVDGDEVFRTDALG